MQRKIRYGCWLVGLLLLGAVAQAEPVAGMFNVYAPIDEAAGYVGCGDDLAEVAKAGFGLVTHDANQSTRYTGLEAWLKLHDDDRALYDAAKAAFSDEPELAFQVFFWQHFLRAAHKQGNGKVQVLVGPLWPLLVDAKAGARAEAAQKFAQALTAFEQAEGATAIAGWFLTEEPVADEHKHSAGHAQPLIDALRAGETAAGGRAHEIYIAESVGRAPKAVGEFFAVADHVLLVQDTYLWNANPPARVDIPRVESLPHALRVAREIAKAVKRENVKFHVALQAFDWAEDDFTQPSHLDMHQQVRLARSGGLADHAPYVGKGAWQEPADGIWLFWWSDCKGERKGEKPYRLNRWDDSADADWNEAWAAERDNAPGAIHVVHDETWFGSIVLIGDVVIHPGVTLTIKPGTMVQVTPMDHYQGGKDKKHIEIQIQGTLVVNGNEQQKVTFRVESEDPKLNAKPKKPNKGDWVGFVVEKGGKLVKNKFTYVSDALKD